jgi:hypothetical protein
LSQLSPSTHLGLSFALGLVSGKSSSFISSLVSLPLADRFGDIAPFGIAVVLCAISFSGNAMRLLLGWGEEGSASHAAKEMKWGGLRGLGDVFWLYILL